MLKPVCLVLKRKVYHPVILSVGGLIRGICISLFAHLAIR